MADLSYAASPEFPSEEEKGQIAQVRAACSAEIAALTCQAEDVVGDLRICRFLRSRHGDVKEATEWFKDFLTWRMEFGMDKMREEVVGRSPEDFMAWYDKRRNVYMRICPYAGRNEDGNILWFISPGMNDPVRWCEHRQHSKDEDEKTINLLLEWTMWYLDELSRKEGRLVYCIKVADFKGLGCDGRKLPIFVPEFKAFFQKLLKSMQMHYCEHDTLFVLLNTSWLFRTLFGFMKLVLTKRQLSKLRVLGDANSEEVRKALARVVPVSLTPAEYGGPVPKLTGFLPVDSPEEIERWYQTRHLVPVELASAAGAESPANPDYGADWDFDPKEVVEVSV